MTLVRIPLVSDAAIVLATLVSRPTHLVIEARIDRQVVLAHLTDRGYLDAWLVPGAPLLLAVRASIGQKKAFHVAGVYAGDELIALDTHVPRRLIAAALEKDALPQFVRYTKVQPKVIVRKHRFDFRLGVGLATCLLNVYPVRQVIDGIARFPDAPDPQVVQQFDVLTELVRYGQRAAVIFVVLRNTAQALVPHEPVDPLFARAFRRALASGVEIYAYCCPPSPEGIDLGSSLPVYGSLRSVPVQ